MKRTNGLGHSPCVKPYQFFPLASVGTCTLPFRVAPHVIKSFTYLLFSDRVR